MLRLPSGEYLGRNLRRTPLPDLPLTLTAYPPWHTYPWHVHEIPTLFVLLAGQHHDENRRVSFDQAPLSVVFHPTQGPHRLAGRDPQLEKAIEVVLEELKKNPPAKPQRPPYPVRVRGDQP